MNGLCNCCSPAAPLTPLPIFNRPGLSAIAYRIGTYASFREAMLEAIATTPELAGLGTREDDDYTITLLDLWAAVSDVLTFYTERYANEIFFRTAQQSQSLRRLAALLGYTPRPGVAALAQLAFTADSRKVIQVPPGLRVQSAPAQDYPAQTYETIEAATVDARFNRLRIYPAPQVQNPLQPGLVEATLSRRQGPQMGAGLAPNDQIVIFNDFGTDPVEEKKVKQLRVEDDRVIVGWTQPVQANTWDKFSAAMKFRRKMQLFGYNVQSPWFHAIADGSVPGGIAWRFDNVPFDLSASNVCDLDSRYSDLSTGASLLFVFATSSGLSTIARTVIQVAQAPRLLGSLTDTITRVTLDGGLAACTDLRSAVVYELTGDDLLFADATYNFKLDTGTVYLPGILVQDEVGIGVEVGRTVQQNSFAAGVVIHLRDVAPGRKFILTDAGNKPVAATLHSAATIDPPGALPGSFVHLVLPLDAESASLDTATAVLLGNIVSASHGETVHNEVAGSGDASSRFQRFPLQKQPLTYLPGAGTNGVISSLQVRVNGLLWQEVPGLYEQPAQGQVYSTLLSGDGRSMIQFGDGDVGGARLPTGTANVAATYRVGAGVAGRVGADALTTLLDRLQGLSSVTNPLRAEGGADPESLEMIRKNAPRTVRTFGRAVSLQDFEDLITASGEVAKAEAIWIWDGLSAAVYLTVAGQAGGTFDDPGNLAANLNSARDTNLRLLLGNFARVPIELAATVLVSPQYVQDDVVANVRAALLQALSFDRLTLGQSIHLSGIYAVLQAMPGVIAANITKFGFVQPDGMSAADFVLYLTSRGVEWLGIGIAAPVQEHLRIFSARTNASVAGQVFPAEMAWIQTPAVDVVIAGH